MRVLCSQVTLNYWTAGFLHVFWRHHSWQPDPDTTFKPSRSRTRTNYLYIIETIQITASLYIHKSGWHIHVQSGWQYYWWRSQSCDFTAHMCTGMILSIYKLFVTPLFKLTSIVCTWTSFVSTLLVQTMSLNSDTNTERRRRRFDVITIRPIIRSAYD